MCTNPTSPNRDDSMSLEHADMPYQNSSRRNEKPQPESGGQGLGLPSSGRLRNKAHTPLAIPATGCFHYDLGRGGKADIW